MYIQICSTDGGNASSSQGRDRGSRRLNSQAVMDESVITDLVSNLGQTDPWVTRWCGCICMTLGRVRQICVLRTYLSRYNIREGELGQGLVRHIYLCTEVKRVVGR